MLKTTREGTPPPKKNTQGEWELKGKKNRRGGKKRGTNNKEKITLKRMGGEGLRNE